MAAGNQHIQNTILGNMTLQEKHTHTHTHTHTCIARQTLTAEAVAVAAGLRVEGFGGEACEAERALMQADAFKSVEVSATLLLCH